MLDCEKRMQRVGKCSQVLQKVRCSEWYECTCRFFKHMQDIRSNKYTKEWPTLWAEESCFKKPAVFQETSRVAVSIYSGCISLQCILWSIMRSLLVLGNNSLLSIHRDGSNLCVYLNATKFSLHH